MKKNFVALLISISALLATLAILHWQSWQTTAYQRYYAAAIVTISTIIALITAVRLIRMQKVEGTLSRRAGIASLIQRRDHFRLTYAESEQPKFVQVSNPDQPGTLFTCPVRDISETGISLNCTGVYDRGQTIHGEILFDSGRTAAVNGEVVRDDARGTSLRLHCAIAPPLLMEEQKQQIRQHKSSGPQPAVDENLLDDSLPGLPSHRPKGICRLKRS